MFRLRPHRDTTFGIPLDLNSDFREDLYRNRRNRTRPPEPKSKTAKPTPIPSDTQPSPMPRAMRPVQKMEEVTNTLKEVKKKLSWDQIVRRIFYGWVGINLLASFAVGGNAVETFFGFLPFIIVGEVVLRNIKKAKPA